MSERCTRCGEVTNPDGACACVIQTLLLEVGVRLMAIIKAKDATLTSLDHSLEFVYKVVTQERERLGPAGLDGHLNSIGGTVLQMRDWIKVSIYGSISKDQEARLPSEVPEQADGGIR